MGHPRFRDAIKGNEAIALKVMATATERLCADTLAHPAASLERPPSRPSPRKGQGDLLRSLP